MRHTFQFRHEREARLVYELAGSSGAELPKAAESKNVIETLPEDMRAMFRYFAEVPNVTERELNAYFDFEKQEGLTPAEAEIKKSLDLVGNVTPGSNAELAVASRKIESVLADINARNKVIAESKAKLRDFDGASESIGPVTDFTYEKSKKVLGTVAEAFTKADWKDKGIMLAGLVSGVYIMRSLWKRFAGGGTLKKILLVAGGGLLSIAAFEAFNKATEKVTGKPLVSFDRTGKMKDDMKPGVVNTADALGRAAGTTGRELGKDLQGLSDATKAAMNGDNGPAKKIMENLANVDPATKGAWSDVGREAGKAMPGVAAAGKEAGRMFPVVSDSKEEWDARKHEKELKELEATLDEIDFPDDFMAEIDAVNARMAPTIATVAPMSVEEFLAIYESGRYTQSIESIPSRKLPKDKLTPQERFAVIEDIAKTLNLVDRETGEMLPLHKERQGASMFLLMMDWKHIPGNEEEGKGGES